MLNSLFGIRTTRFGKKLQNITVPFRGTSYPEFKKQKAEEAKRRRDANPQEKEAYNLKRREARLAKTRNTESS
jgi:hypothetical protein